MKPLDALVLAGRRRGRDALAEAHGATHRALLPILGVPMLLRVVRTLRASPVVGAVEVSIDAPERIDEVPELRALRDTGALAVYRSESSPSRSARARLEARPDAAMLVTTADHPLLTPEMLDFVAEAAARSQADLLVGFVEATTLRSRYPESTRTWLRLRGGAWSGANLFVFRTRAARLAASFWTRAEQHRKQPWRLVAAIGPGLLLRYAAGQLDLDAALAEGSRRIGARIEALPLPFAEAAIDVDRESDLQLAERILAQRETSAGSSSEGSAAKRPVAGS